MRITYLFFLSIIISLIFSAACTKAGRQASRPAFVVLEHNNTGLDFNNTLTQTNTLNMFSYMYFYNGAGVGAGDFNNDGLTDLFFASNQGSNKLFLNEGKLYFKDVSEKAKIPQDHGWSTGVSVVDINNDGLLDIYICKVGKFAGLKSENQLLVCKGIESGVPFYEDQAEQYGLNFSGFGTQASFFDYDMDGDLDMYLLNHALHHDGSFAPRIKFLNTYDALSGDRLYRNDGDHFTDVTRQSGINSSAIGYGLGIAVSDINLDGWPDIYIGNDFHENDYLYINRKNGTFADENTQRLMHTSKFSMGVDIADVNNDGYPEIMTADMLPADPYILKRSLGDDDYDIFYDKIAFGYNYQYSRNTLQYNRKNGMFSETGLYSGIYATDWSWAPLLMDFDNDGLKDLFISNGIPTRLNDMDYVRFIYNSEIQKRSRDGVIENADIDLMKKYPEIKIPNKFYKNQSKLQFQDMESAISNDLPCFSNGAVYADFDNDGDLDVVVNNINDFVLLYENRSVQNGNEDFVSVTLNGPEKNRNAFGAKLILFANGGIRLYENNPVKGFMSGMVAPMHIGLYQTKVDSAMLVWPDNSFQKITLQPATRHIAFTYTKDLPVFDYSSIAGFSKRESRSVTDITAEVQLDFIHKENSFNEFNREPLMPHMVSTEGPALAVADINKDGLEDIFIGASKSFHNAVFLQKPGGVFLKTPQDCLLQDSMYEDTDAVWCDVNNDGNIDLIVASGGNEYYGANEHLLPRIYLNDGKANFAKAQDPFTDQYVTASCIAFSDFNGDGFVDLFLGGRVVPWNYGETPTSYLLQNDGKGKFADVTLTNAKELSKTGMVTDALWLDVDKDGDNDLVVSCEWGPISVFLNTNGIFTKKDLTDKKGWWNFILPIDIDADGDMDFVAGNLGLNSRLHASVQEPVRLYFNDFDNNDGKEQILTYYVQGKEIPFAGKDELEKQMPLLKKKYAYAEDFAKATLTDIFSAMKIKDAMVLSADYFSNAILINNGNLNFSVQPLPWEAQLTTYRDAVIVDADNDSLPDLLLGGNYYANSIAAGRYDADHGTILINKGNGKLQSENLNGTVIKGEVRHIKPIKIAGKDAFIVARNNDNAMVLKFTDPGK
ncbi:VCBS repeat-containing protein [Agriterribacter sp.]|uniref:VCBS repeat-containing protein n=1 Tax=Agriterribacter sp. TaxID=2821509 RepID=UPI002B60CFE3|nr:VCBS repeat-containing protein [Agriterribacter sp.]HRP56764.1 VCBS repeat-containing protein [Agriterribacter sp.]